MASDVVRRERRAGDTWAGASSSRVSGADVCPLPCTSAETPEGQGRIDSTYEPPGRGHLRVVGDGMPGEATNHLARRLVQACIFGVAMWHMLRASPRRE